MQRRRLRRGRVHRGTSPGFGGGAAPVPAPHAVQGGQQQPPGQQDQQSAQQVCLFNCLI